MGTQKGIIKIVGSLDGMSFYKTKNGYKVRTKGGPTKDQIEKDPNFARTRENNEEFTNIVGSSKQLRKAASVLIKKAYDGRLSNRLVAKMSIIKNADLTSPRGQRKVAIGIQTPEGIAILKGMNLNERAPLETVMAAPFTLDTSTGTVTIPVMTPAGMLTFPLHATHVTFQSAFINLDFQTGDTAVTYSLAVNLPLNTVLTNVVLAPTAVPPGSGTRMFFLLIEFFQEINGVQYALNNGNFNALNLLDLV